MKKLMKIIGIIILVPVVLIIVFLIALSFRPMAPRDYTKEVQTGGVIEARYLEMGEHDTKSVSYEGSELTKRYYVYYPEELKDDDREYPVVVVLNGTGVLPKKYKALFRHLASWGFVVVGNDDASTGFGKSADETMEFIMSANSDAGSIFYKRLDLENVGITGHSQGGAGVFTAISVMEHKDKYRTAVALSPTHEEVAHQLGWMYDLEQISIPTLVVAGTEGDFETLLVIPPEKLSEMYGKISSSKLALRRVGAEHGHMLYAADGYVTAWFMWQLKADKEAGKAFIGQDAEVMTNKLYQDIEKSF